MNDEIKEILDEMINLNDYQDYKIYGKRANERLKDDFKNDVIRDVIVERDGYLEQLEDYKSRCEKASDKLGNYKHYSTPTEEQNSENEDIVDSALNILQNGDVKNGN